MSRILGLVAGSCGLWLACSEVHEKPIDPSGDASSSSAVEGPTPSTAGADDASASTASASHPTTPADSPAGRCMRVVLDVKDQPDDLAPCVYAIDPEVVDPQYVAVIVGRRIRGLDRTQDGFKHEAGRVTLLGSACDDARSGASVEMRLSCAPIAREARGEYTVPECHARAFDPNELPADRESRCRYRVLPTNENAKYIRVIVGGRVVALGTRDGFALQSGIVTLSGDACERALGGERVEVQNECNGVLGLQ